MFENIPFVLDGSTGYMLSERGLPSDVSTELWIKENPEKLIELQREYIAAGSNAVYAPTFGANRPTLERHGYSGDVAQINKELVAISRKAVQGSDTLVAGDMSPTGLLLEPFGDTSLEQAIEIYKEQALALEQAGVDFFVVETMISLPEARAAVIAIREVSQKPILATMTCDSKGRTMSGNDAPACVAALEAVGITAFGLNCSTGPEDMVATIARVAEFTDLPLAVKPNAGVPHVDGEGKTVFDVAPKQFASCAEAFYDAGVRIFGGCCGTGPEHIAALTAELKKCAKKEAEKADMDGQILLSCEKSAFVMSDDVQIPPSVDCDDDIVDVIMDFEDEILHINITDGDSVAAFAENAYALDAPLAVTAENEELLEAFARIYCGVFLLVECAGDEVKIAELKKKYGFKTI